MQFKGLFSLVLALGFSLTSFSQILEPVHWSHEVKRLSPNTFEIILKAKMDAGWAIYSQSSDPNAAQPTEISIQKAPGLELIGKAEEIGKKKEGPEPLFDNLIVSKYYDHVAFVQKIKVKDPSKPIQASAYFMSCNSEKCIPPTNQDFAISLNGEALEEKSMGGMPGSMPQTSVGLSGNPIQSEPSGLLDPVKVKSELISKENGVYTLKFIADIQEGWFIYSHDIGEDGPLPTSIEFSDSASFEKIGAISENSEHKLEGYDEIFEMKLIKYKHQVSFSQDIKVKDNSKPIKGFFTFQSCDATKCLPPKDINFVFDPAAKSLKLETEGIGIITPNIIDGNSIDLTVPALIETQKNPAGQCGEERIEGKNHFWTFIFGFLGGLLALLTPCVFPMIPLTVSFFTKETKRKGFRNALIYGLSIIVIYVAIGILITAVFGATALNELSTNWIANTLFFIIFIIFAFSFFGYYEITLPSSWANKSDKMAESGGLIGIFFMAFTLAIVSFSCTGPIIGSAIVQSATSKMGPFIVMLGFSTALAIPFGLFAAFPAFLNSLPKSGSWMNSVKVVLGFLELALAFKFLSVADMCQHWGILGYELFMGFWVLIFALMSLYLFGFIKFPHDSPLKKLSATRWMFALASLAATIYLSTGFMYNKELQSYNSLKLMSGLAPPANYNYFLASANVNQDIKNKYPSFTKCANNLDCFKNYHEGLAFAKEVNKPMLVDFTGYGCVNCRKTEEHIWVDVKVRNRIANDYVLVSLYVDDRSPLDKELYSAVRKTPIRNIGNKWADFQIVNFNQNSQPLYVLVSPKEEVLAKPRGFKEGVESYEAFLDCGLDAFNKIKSVGFGH
ncbi:MAG: thioredoxin family protein [Saprospiraceae bacterium]|nr:thioredoxin family protein [Saprospiraceae bacterium]